jgi:hypothetical protein
VALGVPLVLLLLFTFGPTIILLTGGMAADALGCTMPISATGPCWLMGFDIAAYLAVAVAFGYLAFDLSGGDRVARHLACRRRDRHAGLVAATVAGKRERAVAKKGRVSRRESEVSCLVRGTLVPHCPALAPKRFRIERAFCHGGICEARA